MRGLMLAWGLVAMTVTLGAVTYSPAMPEPVLTRPADVPKPGDHYAIVYQGENGTAAIDTDSVKDVAPNIKSVIPLLIFADTSDGIAALTGRLEFNCLTQEYFVRSRIFLNDKAEVVKIGDPDKNFHKVDHKSVAADIWTAVCKRDLQPSVET